MPRNRLPRLTEKLHAKRQKEPGETIEEASGYVRPERGNKWPTCMIATWWWWWWWWLRGRHIIFLYCKTL